MIMKHHLLSAMMASTMNPSHPSTMLFDAHNHIHMSLGDGMPIPPLSFTTINAPRHRPTEAPSSKPSSSGKDDDENYDEIHDTERPSLDTLIESHAIDIFKEFSLPSLLDQVEKSEYKEHGAATSRVPKSNREDLAVVNSKIGDGYTKVDPDVATTNLYAMALMSTQPRDYPIVEKLIHSLSVLTLKKENNTQNAEENKLNYVIPCFGVHPWFLKQANSDFESKELMQYLSEHNAYSYLFSQGSYQNEETESDETNLDNMSLSYQLLLNEINYNKNSKSKNSDKVDNGNMYIPSWLPYLYHKIQSNPTSQVGEIGLDNARYDPITKEIVCPLEDQLLAFEAQLHLAAHLGKAVSIHSVRCWGVLFDSLQRVKKQRQLMKKDLKKMYKDQERRKVMSEDNASLDRNFDYYFNDKGDVRFHILPPRMYMHAFGGNPSIVDQLYAICCKDASSSELIYGFAPIINFRSQKTADTIRKIGIDHLVLESDLEDYRGVRNDLISNVEFISNTLELECEEVIEKTNQNANRLYSCGIQR